MMGVCLSSNLKPKGLTWATAAQNFDSMELLEHGYSILIIDIRHQHQSVKKPTVQNGVEWAAKSLRMRAVDQIRSKPISPA